MLKLADKYDTKDILDRLLTDHDRSLQETGGSFYNNRAIILDAFKNNNLWAIKPEERRVLEDPRTLGFLVGTPHRGDLDILEVWSEFRRKGIGHSAVNEFVEIARQKRSIGVRVTCHPPSSEAFWRAQGFTPPPVRHDSHEIELFRSCQPIRCASSSRRWRPVELRFEIELLGDGGPQSWNLPGVFARQDSASVIFQTPIALPENGLRKVAVFCDDSQWLGFVDLKYSETVRRTPYWIAFKRLDQDDVDTD